MGFAQSSEGQDKRFWERQLVVSARHLGSYIGRGAGVRGSGTRNSSIACGLEAAFTMLLFWARVRLGVQWPNATHNLGNKAAARPSAEYVLRSQSMSSASARCEVHLMYGSPPYGMPCHGIGAVPRYSACNG